MEGTNRSTSFSKNNRDWALSAESEKEAMFPSDSSVVLPQQPHLLHIVPGPFPKAQLPAGANAVR